MKFAAFKASNASSEILVGIVADDEQSIQALGFSPAQATSGVAAVVQAQAAGQMPPPLGKQYALSSVRLMAPFPRPARNILCVGKNYFDHAKEFARSGFDSSAKPGDVLCLGLHHRERRHSPRLAESAQAMVYGKEL